MITSIQNKRKQNVGWIDDKNCYHSKRSYTRGQIFRHPKYQSGIAVDTDILKELIQRKVKKIIIEIKDFEKRPFFIETDIDHFLKNSEKINFDKKSEHLKVSTFYSEQRVMPMNLWKRFYFDQKKIMEYKL